MKKITIIGGGASGLITAINCKTNDNEVILIEKNKVCGKKILLTGNGRCNFWNAEFSLNHFNSSDKELLNEIILQEDIDNIIPFFESLGLVFKEKNGYYYPFSNQAVTIKNLLEEEALKRKVEIITETVVLDIEKNNNKYFIKTNKDIITTDVVVLATGSKAFPKTGSDGFGYSLLRKMGYKIVKPVPALDRLKLDASYLKDWAGIRTDVTLSYYEEGNLKKIESGEIQLTDYGISGICTFNISGLVNRGLLNGKKQLIKINFLPFLNNYEEAFKFLNKQSKICKNEKIITLLERILNYKLVKVILRKTKISENINYSQLKDYEIDNLILNLISFEVIPFSSNSFEQSQVCSGGLKLSEVSSTLELINDKNFFVVGELLDIDGDCGGYNLGFAWISGIKVGKAIKEND